MPMGKRALGFSPLVYGCMRMNEWRVDAPRRLDRIKAILDAGIDTFDHADIYGDYGNEVLFGEALALEPGLRSRMKLITKCGIQLVSASRPDIKVKHYTTRKSHILSSVDSSLSKLGTDRIDLLLIHRPDYLLEPAEVGEAFAEIAASGKAAHFGVSNFGPSQCETLRRFSPVPIEANQVEISPLHLDALQDGTLDQCVREGLFPMAWSPFSGGRLFSSADGRAARALAAVDEAADALGVAREAAVLAWIMRLPGGPTPVVGSGDLGKLRRMAAAARIRMGTQEWYKILEASLGHPVA